MTRWPNWLTRKRGRFGSGAVTSTNERAVAAIALSETASDLAASLERLVRDVEGAIGAHQRVLAQVTERLERLDRAGGSDGSPKGISIDSHEAALQCRADLVARLFGPFEVSLGGVPVGSWRSQKAASLLKYVLLHDNGLARCETLMDVFWPSSSPKAARNNLNVTIYQLRGTLKAVDPTRNHIIHSESAYRLDPRLSRWSDVQEFSRAVQLGRRSEESGDDEAALAAYRQARTLYRGMLLEGDSSGEWFLDTQRRLHQEHCGLLERLGNLLLEQDDLTESAIVGEELLVEDPCRETGYQLLMRAYAALRQPQLVVRQYQRCTEMLRRELSVSPAPATIALYGRLVSKC